MKQLSYTWYCVLGTLIYFCMSSFICKFVLNIADFNTESTLFENFYFRGMVFSEYLPTGQLFYYWIMLPVGFTFVNIVNLSNERKNPFLDNHMSYRSFFLTVTLVAPVFFFVSAIVTLRGQHDLDGYCHTELVPQKQVYLTGDPFLDSLPRDPEPECKVYTRDQVFDYNYYIWTIGFFIGLQFTHMD